MNQPSLFAGSDAYGMPIPVGATFDPALDGPRLNAQARRVFAAMKGGAWMTLGELSAATGDPEASVSARLRELRRPEFGGYAVNRRRRGEAKRGLWEYQLEAKG